MDTTLRSANKTVRIGLDRPLVVIGEKINPTGRKKMSDALQNSDFDYIRELAQSQVRAGADVLDVNVGVPGLDEVAIMPVIVRLLAETVDIPYVWIPPIHRR